MFLLVQSSHWSISCLSVCVTAYGNPARRCSPLTLCQPWGASPWGVPWGLGEGGGLPCVLTYIETWDQGCRPLSSCRSGREGVGGLAPSKRPGRVPRPPTPGGQRWSPCQRWSPLPSRGAREGTGSLGPRLFLLGRYKGGWDPPPNPFILPPEKGGNAVQFSNFLV